MCTKPFSSLFIINLFFRSSGDFLPCWMASSTVWPLSLASLPGWLGRQLRGHQQARTAHRFLG